MGMWFGACWMISVPLLATKSGRSFAGAMDWLDNAEARHGVKETEELAKILAVIAGIATVVAFTPPLIASRRVPSTKLRDISAGVSSRVISGEEFPNGQHQPQNRCRYQGILVNLIVTRRQLSDQMPCPEHR
jgi:hypothetical protein